MKMISQRGMALVTSLIMLGLVTMLAIAFIGLARRDRASVEVTKKTTEAKMMADASLARAQVEIMECIRNNINFQLIASTNGPIGSPTVDPRVPVSYTVNGQADDRSFLNLNRNLDVTGLPRPESTTVTETGDLQWIGVLEDSTQPHGPDNRFTGRYAYMIVPASKATGLDWMGSNHSMAAMLHQLDRSAVNSASRTSWPYDHYYPSGPWASRSGSAFTDATVWLANRSRLLEPNADVFTSGKVGANFVSKWTNASAADPYTFYKLAGSFSPDGGIADRCLLPVPPYITNKFHLNNPFALSTTDYFHEVAGRLLAASTIPQGNSSYFVGSLGSGWPLSSIPRVSSMPNGTRIMIYPENQYTPEVHRLLQLAVNITDTVLNTGDFHPLVFRPILEENSGQVFIKGFIQETTDAFLGNRVLNLPTDISIVNANSLTALLGMVFYNNGPASFPILIASKEKWQRPTPPLTLPLPPDPYAYPQYTTWHLFPNFNEISIQTVWTTDFNVNSPPVVPPSSTLDLSARISVETWNSTGFPPYLMNGAAQVPTLFNLMISNTLYGVADEAGQATPFASTMVTNIPSLQMFSGFHTVSWTQPLWARARQGAAAVADRPNLNVQMTNWVRYALTHNGRVVDYVSAVVANTLDKPEHKFPGNAGTDGKAVDETAWQVDDPFVNDLAGIDLKRYDYSRILPGRQLPKTSPTPNPVNIGFRNAAYKPSTGVADIPMKDREAVAPGGINLHSGAFPDVGYLGRVHRGTPWQTVYFKSPVAPAATWIAAGRTIDTHPTNDWRLPDLFTVAPSAAAATGLPSVNNTQEAAWAAVLAGVSMRTQPEDWLTPGTRDYVRFDLRLSQPSGYNWNWNPPPNNNFHQLFRQDRLSSYTAGGCTSVVTPNGPGSFTLSFTNPAYRHYTWPPPTFAQVTTIYSTNITVAVSGSPYVFSGDLITPLTQSINAQRNTAMGNGKPFALTGQFLGTPGLTVGGVAPFSWNWSSDQDDERIPTQILSRLRVEDEPIVVVYAWGQSLKPADKSIVTSGVNVGLVNNYVVTGQVGTRTVLRVKNFNPAVTNQPPRMVVESFRVLP